MSSNVEKKPAIDAKKDHSKNNDFIDIANFVQNLIPVDRNTVKASHKTLVWLTDLKKNPCVRDNWLVEVQGFLSGLWACGVISSDDVLSFKNELEQRGLRVTPENFDYLNIINEGYITTGYLNKITGADRPNPTRSEHAAKLDIIKELRRNRISRRNALRKQKPKIK